MENEVDELEVEQATFFLAKNLVLSERMDGDGELEGTLFLAGKILARYPTGAKRVFDIFSGIWRCKKPWSVKEIKPGILQFKFGCREDLERVFGGRPWMVKGSLMLLYQWPPFLTAEEIEFRWSPFWLRLVGLPPGFQNFASAKELAGMFGRFISCSVRQGHNMRIRVEIDTRKKFSPVFFLIGTLICLYGFKENTKIWDLFASSVDVLGTMRTSAIDEHGQKW